MSYERLANLSEEKRSRIMETALDEFLDKNFKSASINQISKKADLSAGALYYYFEDKVDLFNTTIDYVVSKLWSQVGNLENMFESKGYWEGIEFLIRKRIETTNDYPRHMKLFHRVLTSNDPVESSGKERFLEYFREVFEYGFDGGYIRDDIPKELVFDIHLNMTLSVNRWSLNSQLCEDIDIDDVTEKVVEMIKAAVGRRI